MENNKTMSKIRIVSIQEKSLKSGNRYPYMVKSHHKKFFDSELLPEIQKEYDAEMQEGFVAILHVRKLK